MVQARAGIDYESSYGKARPNDTILKLQRTTPYYKRNRAHICSFYIRGECTRGAECPYRHEMPVTGELSQQNIKDRYYGYVWLPMTSSFDYGFSLLDLSFHCSFFFSNLVLLCIVIDTGRQLKHFLFVMEIVVGLLDIHLVLSWLFYVIACCVKPW